ncbi:MAG: AMP-dependent synthetase and ligase [Gammaproteobacteria bacterium]|jgi:fatty-acyl-CoA synthase|nr:AMP-dependent synthetase and ligase [Gammaproteobacteria bacterium]
MSLSDAVRSMERTLVVPETADAELLNGELRSLADMEAIERTPLEERLPVNDFTRRVALALAARDAADTAIFYVPDGDIERQAECISFATLRDNIERTASLLRAHGIGRTDVIAILMPAVPALYWSVLGAMSAGIPFPVNWMLESEHVLHLLQEANAKAVITLGPTPGFKIWESIMSFVGRLPSGMPIWSVPGPGGAVVAQSDLSRHIAQQGNVASPSGIAGNDIAAYVHSGGTTGLPKIVKLSHTNMSYRHWALQLASKAVLGEVVLHDTPMFHIGGLAGRCLPPLASGASVLIPSVMGARDKRYIANYWKFVEKYRVTRLSGVPTTLATLARSPPQGEDLSSLKPYFITGSTAMPVAIREQFERISGVRVLNSYGLTENTASVAIDPRDGMRKEGSSGIRLPYTKIRAVQMDDKGSTIRHCEPGEIGMLQIQGPGVTPACVNPVHDSAARTTDGWLITGDLGRIDNDGFLFVTGRAKDVIIRGGHNIDPALIEEVLLQSPGVLHAAAVGKPDAYAGELPVAYVQLIPGSQATAPGLIAFVAEHIAERAAIPKEIFIVDRIPLTAVGKPAKAALRREVAERTFRSVLSAAIGLSCESGQFQVAVKPHATHGALVTIVMMDTHSTERDILAGRIQEVMGRYSFAYVIEWGD